MLFKWHGETRVRFTEQPKGTQYMEHFQKFRKEFFTVRCMTSGIIGGIKVTVPWMTSKVQEHQRTAKEQVEIAAALATSRTAAQMPSRFRDIENKMLRRIFSP